MGSYLHRVESSLGEYLHKHDKDEVYGGLRYDCVDDSRILERVPVTVGVPNDDSERGNFYSRIRRERHSTAAYLSTTTYRTLSQSKLLHSWAKNRERE